MTTRKADHKPSALHLHGVFQVKSVCFTFAAQKWKQGHFFITAEKYKIFSCHVKWSCLSLRSGVVSYHIYTIMLLTVELFKPAVMCSTRTKTLRYVDVTTRCLATGGTPARLLR